MKKIITKKVLCLLLCAAALLTGAGCTPAGDPAETEGRTVPETGGAPSGTADAAPTEMPTETPTETPAPEYPAPVGISFDSVWMNSSRLNNPDGEAGKWLDKNKPGRRFNGKSGSITSFVFRGWAGFEYGIEAFGYRFGEEEPVLNPLYIYRDPADLATVRLPQYGGPFAERFIIVVDTAGLRGEGKLTAVAKLTDGSIRDLATEEESISIVYAGSEKVQPAETAETPGIDRDSAVYRRLREDNFAAGKLPDTLLDSVNPGVLVLLGNCMYYESRLQEGIAKGQKWVYSNSSTYVPQSGKFDSMANGSSKWGANCAMAQAWALIDMGVVTNGKHIWGNDDCGLSNIDTLGASIRAAADIEYIGGAGRFCDLYELGQVEPGDVFFAQGHTFIYLGDEKFMATGHDAKWHKDASADTEDSRKAVFETWVVDMKTCGNWTTTVHWRLRFRDGFVPKYYRSAEGKIVPTPGN